MREFPGALGLPFFAVGEDTDSEARVVARLRAGDLTALGETYDAHQTHVRAFARRLVGDDSAAEDLVQDTFIALVQSIARFRGDAPLRTFLLSIAANHARHHVRAAVRRRAALGRLATEPSNDDRSPESKTAVRQLAAELTAALDDLPIDQRVAIVLCEVEERTAAEAAQIAGAPEATMRTRVFHAKRKLRETLQRRRA